MAESAIATTMDKGEDRDGLAQAAKAPLGLILMLGALSTFGPVSTDMYLPGLPAMGRELHAGAASVQQTVASYFIGISFGQLVYGPLSDRVGRRWPLLVGIGLYVIASIGCVYAATIQMLIALRVVQALGGCAGMVISRAVVRDLFKHREVTHVFSMLMLVMGVAPILAPFLGGLMLQVASWRMIFVLQAAFGFLVLLGVLFTLKESRSEATAVQARGEHPFRSYLTLLRRPRLMGYVLTGAFSGAGLFVYIATSPDIVIGHFNVPPQSFGWLFGLNAFGFIACAQVNARLARRTPADDILKWGNIGCLISAFALLATALTGWGGLTGFMIPMFCIMASLGFTQPNSQAGALGEDPSRAGSTAALQGFIGFSAGAGAAALSGLFRDGTAGSMASVLVLSLLVAVIALRTLVRSK